MLMMEVDSDSGPEMWGSHYGTATSQRKGSSTDSETDNMSLANFQKKAEAAKRLKKRRRKKMKNENEQCSDENLIKPVKRRKWKKKTEKKEKCYECDACGSRLKTKTEVRQHWYIHRASSEQSLRSGEIVNTEIVESQNPSPDLRETNSLTKWPCEGCQRLFSSESSLMRHINSFPGPHYFPCEVCGIAFLKNEVCLKHIAIKHPVPVSAQPLNQPFTCSKCGSRFSSEEYMQVHSVEVHGDFVSSAEPDPKYCCQLCGKEFLSVEGLHYHEQNQHKDTADKPKRKRKASNNDAQKLDGPAGMTLVCKICSASLDSKSALQSHLKTHNVKKNMELKTGVYQCLICPRSFSSSDGLKYHLATHTGERRYGCSQCDRRFIKKTHLSEHLATHSNVKYFTCERCPRTFSTHSAYKKHIKMFPGPHNFFCAKCGKVFMKESMLEKHLCVDLVAIALAPEVVAQLSEDMIEAYMCLAEEADSAERTRPGSMSCYKCFKIFSSEAELQEHQHEHLGKQLYQCRFCPENFNRSDLFSAHIVNHLGSTPYMCRQCNRKFISPFTLATHLKNYPGEHSFSCTRCKRWFPSSERLEKHDCILQNSDVFLCACSKQFKEWSEFLEHFGKKPFKCCSCAQEFVTLTPLTRHIQRHTGNRPFACDLCTKAFLTKASLQSHLRIHNKSEAQLACTLCDYQTFYQRRFDFHMSKRHGVEGDNTLCPVCGVLYPNIETMKAHIELDHENAVAIDDTSEGKKSLPTELCNLCGKMLTNKYSLRSHMNSVHCPTKPKSVKEFSCPVCGETFRRLNQLERHGEKHDEPGLRPCSLCDVTCSSRKDLRKHMRKHNTYKPFSCDNCHKRFKVAVSLKYHATICSKLLLRKEQEARATLQVPIYELEPTLMTPVKWTY